MTIGISQRDDDFFSVTRLCEQRLSESSVFRLLHEEGQRLFPDEGFADLFHGRGRRSVAPRVFATVMVLQRVEGLSDREAVERFAFDIRWKYAAGGLPVEYPSFAHTVLVDVRERLRASERPDRIFEAVLEVGKKAGLVGRRRVLDSTALYDAVATQDTVTMIRSAIRGLLRAAEEPLATELRKALRRDDDYSTPGKPVCEWDDEAAREALVDALARDGFAVLAVLDGRELAAEVRVAAELLATVLGQDLEQREDGLFRIARRVAPDRVISTVDPEARHGHKTAARGFDGYKGHIAVDPDSEIITSTMVTAGNVGDAVAAERLLADLLPAAAQTVDAASVEAVSPAGPARSMEPAQTVDAASVEAASPAGPARSMEPAQSVDAASVEAAFGEPVSRPEVFGDASYGTADMVERLEAAGIEAYTKVQPPAGRHGKYSQDAFEIDTAAGTVRCPAGIEVKLRKHADGSGHAGFGTHCANCPLRTACTESKTGRSVNIHAKHDTLHRSRKKQRDPAWKEHYRSTRPKIERKFGHLMRRKHGGRRARMRGAAKVSQDFAMLAAATNLQRLAALGTRWSQTGWTCTARPRA